MENKPFKINCYYKGIYLSNKLNKPKLSQHELRTSSVLCIIELFSVNKIASSSFDPSILIHDPITLEVTNILNGQRYRSKILLEIIKYAKYNLITFSYKNKETGHQYVTDSLIPKLYSQPHLKNFPITLHLILLHPQHFHRLPESTSEAVLLYLS